MKLTLVKSGIFFSAFCLLFFQTISAQTVSAKKISDLDKSIQAGFGFLKARKFADAATNFEAANKTFEKENQPSEILFDLIDVPDEDKSDPPTSPTERQFISYRHATATKQALLQFLAFTYQLDGKSTQAEKYFKEVYELQGPLWGTSWRVFAPLFYKLYDAQVSNETGENAGRYHYFAGSLLLDSGEKMLTVFEILQKAQKNSPKDADVSGLLANGYLQKKNPTEAKKQAESSLSVKPNVKSVLIDLATAEWLLEEFDNSIKHCEAAIKLDPVAPGPYMTLALNYIGKNDIQKALQEASKAVDLSRRHPFYLTVQSAANELAGNKTEAEKLLSEAWQNELPTSKDLDVWYINKKLRETVLITVKRMAAPKADA